MLYSKLFGKTLKIAPKEADAISHKLLIQGGFIDRQLAAGIYSFLPLGWRVHQKIAEIIRQEINAVDGQEVFLPTLQPRELWEKTSRWGHMDPPLFTVKDRHQKEFALGSTHEEVITDLAARFIKSYKDLPLALYQIQNKFRNEMRATGGLLRVREFVMKDLYSFHADEKDLENYYQKVRQAYLRVFTRCGFEVKVVEASSGSIGGAVNHELMLLCETGEDTILSCQKCDWAANVEKVKEAKTCPVCGGVVTKAKTIENGHIFNLGTKYSESLGVYFTDKDGKKKPAIMGCYGIGIGRLMASIVEVHHDERGIIWPEAVAPLKAHLIVICDTQDVTRKAEKIYDELQKSGVEILYDDREEISAGEKFADADLIGIPVRLVISEKTLLRQGFGGQSKIEWKHRGVEKVELLTLDEVLERLKTHRLLDRP